MEHVESTAAIFGSMTIEDTASGAEASAQEIAQELASSIEQAQEEGATQESAPAQEEGAQEEGAPAGSAQALAGTIGEGLRELMEDGWSGEELAAFAADAQVIADLAAGKSMSRAASAFSRRAHAQAAKPPAKKGGLPITQANATGGAAPRISMEDMTDAQFDAFSRRAQEAAMMGKRVRM